MKLKKLLCIALALLTVFAVVACGNDKKEGSKGDAQESDREFLEYIGIEDFEGYEFRILTKRATIQQQYLEEEPTEAVNLAVYNRNKIVESLFNVNIIGYASANDQASEATTTILAGSDDYDMILPHTRTAFSYVTQSCALNIYDIETIHLDKEWWHQDLIDTCTINGNLYVLDGDINIESLGLGATMYFNKTLFDELGLEYPYQLVKDGKWTFDEFSKLVKTAWDKDLNDDGRIERDVDAYGFATSEWWSPIYILYAGGQKVYTKDASGLPTLTINSDKTVKIYSDFFALANSEDVFMANTRNGTSQDAVDIFAEGRALFVDGDLSQATVKRSMDDEFGILPFPKFEESDEYSTIVNAHAGIVIVPMTVSDPNRTGKIIEALCAISSRDVIPTYYDTALKTRSARDDESEDMIDIIRDTLTYDIGYMNNTTFGSTGQMLANLKNPDFAAYYNARESEALATLEEFLVSYGNISVYNEDE